MLEQFRILFERGTAATGVVEDHVVVAGEENVDVTPRQLLGFLAQADVCVQSAAAALSAGHGYFASVLLKHTDSSLVQPREAHVGYAAGEKPHLVAPRAFGRKRLSDVAEKERPLGVRREPLQFSEFAEQLQDARGAH